MTPEISRQMQIVTREFHGVPTRVAPVHASAELSALLEMLLGVNDAGTALFRVPVKRRRQGKRGSNSARNYLLRQALWFARQHEVGT